MEIDRALSDLYERILREYIYPWYGQVSLDEQFVHEVRLALRHATAVLVKRVGKVSGSQKPNLLQTFWQR